MLCPSLNPDNSSHAPNSLLVSKLIYMYTTLYAHLDESKLLEVSKLDNLDMKVGDAKNQWLQMISRF